MIAKMPQIILIISTHTLTWSVTVVTISSALKNGNFNSHAHVERDVLSIFGNSGISAISTHTLTWSVTSDFESRPCSYGYFNSHAHVERDIQGLQVFTIQKISTHTLTWSVTLKMTGFNVNMSISTHTLTWSVTMNICQLVNFTRHFNSHAHVERDINSSCFKYII